MEIEGIAVNGIDLLKWNEEGLVVEFKVLIRPLKAIISFTRKWRPCFRRSSSRCGRLTTQSTGRRRAAKSHSLQSER